ncbi:hypothetical protein JCGZ_15295 [Jatropha curcas]|uniref:Uncharacterized protein n=1 Tax=Jatropha curcas TaxID=180498 RepID=A0A067LBJ6_JATCU|nr:uncharacterized protein LOC105637381 [Jatropha curcas]KDP45851.1 hypothetical protein JCGZ_15295 [Jatropha curcas]
MESFDDDPFESSSSKDHQKVENVHNLLEDGWFFGELLSRKPKAMPRCYSDPSPNFSQEIISESYYLLNPSKKKPAAKNLIRAPSLPPCIGRRSEEREIKKLSRQLSDQDLVQEAGDSCKGKIEEKERPLKQRLLIRTPSLPHCIGREEEIEEHESDITMSKLIRQAMPHTSKGLTQTSSMSKYRPPRSWKVETVDTVKETKNSSRRNLKKSLSNLESQIEGFKDLEFPFNKQDLNPSKAGIIPVSENKKKQNQDLDQDKVRRRPCLSETWHVQSCASPIPIWAAKSSTQDMKAQLKCWARAVASNVR